MKKKNNKKGFTLAELLIVVAIIAVLTAIAIPVFGAQLEKARDSTDQANIRSAYAELTAALLLDDTASLTATTNGASFHWTWTDAGEGTPATAVAAIAGKGKNTDWDNTSDGKFMIGDIDIDAAKEFSAVTFTVNSEDQITDITLG